MNFVYLSANFKIRVTCILNSEDLARVAVCHQRALRRAIWAFTQALGKASDGVPLPPFLDLKPQGEVDESLNIGLWHFESKPSEVHRMQPPLELFRWILYNALTSSDPHESLAKISGNINQPVRTCS